MQFRPSEVFAEHAVHSDSRDCRLGQMGRLLQFIATISALSPMAHPVTIAGTMTNGQWPL